VFKTIIIGIDGHDGGADALALAGRLADDGTRLIAVCVAVLDARVSRAVSLDYDAVVVEGADEVAAAAAAADPRIEPVPAAADPRIETVPAVAGSAAAGMHDVAEREGADLVVIGSCRRGRIGRILSGDDTREIVRSAPCPVAVAPIGYAHAGRPIAVVGVGYDGRPEAAPALALARRLAARAGTPPRAIEIVGVPNWAIAPGGAVYLGLEEERRAAQERLDALEGVDGEAKAGSAFQDLRAFSHEVDLLVVGSRRQGALGRIVLGSASESLLGGSECPLIIVPRPAALAAEAPAAEAAAAEAPS
jgi:nucleotide-binding universal stress UspA family protein